MKRLAPAFYLLAALLMITVGGYALHLYLKGQTSTPQWTGNGAASLPAFKLPDIDGNLRDSDEWNGKVLIVNFWATWCPPCRKEMPLFIEMQEKYGHRGIQFVAIAIDDPDMVRDFHDVYGINFPTLIGGAEAIQLANRLGNRFDSLPFTAIFDRGGKTRYIQAGEMQQAVLEQQILPLL